MASPSRAASITAAMPALHRAGVMRVAMAEGADPLHQRARAHAFDGLFRGAVNIQDEDAIGLMERAGEIVQQRLRAGVTVRLEQNVDRAGSGRLARPPASREFRWDDGRNRRSP